MISKNRIKLIRSLEQKKHRRESGLFVAEGPKLVGELLPAYPCAYLAATSRWLAEHTAAVADLRARGTEVDEVTPQELERASLLRAPQEVLTLMHLPQRPTLPPAEAATRLVLALDDVQDPGNLGTIVRLADWFGIEDVVCSEGSADVFNPKAMQATMGAPAGVRVHYTPLPQWLAEAARAGAAIYGTSLQGTNLYAEPLSPCGVIVMGNEGRGVSAEVEALVSRRLYIPPFPAGRATSESLNVAIATAVICAEFRRRENPSSTL